MFLSLRFKLIGWQVSGNAAYFCRENGTFADEAAASEHCPYQNTQKYTEKIHKGPFFAVSHVRIVAGDDNVSGRCALLTQVRCKTPRSKFIA